MNRECFIYRILCVVNGGSYIGSTLDIRKRKDSHWTMLKHGRHHCRRMQYSANKYGLETFIIKVVEVCQESVRAEREQVWLLATQLNGKPFNTAPSVNPRRHSEETRRRLSEIQVGRKDSEETRTRKSLATAGVPKSVGHARNISAGLMFFRGDRLAELLSLRAEGWGVSKLAAHFGCDRHTVRKTLNGLHTASRGWSDPLGVAKPNGRYEKGRVSNRKKFCLQDARDIVAARARGMKWADIAELKQCNIGTLFRVIDREMPGART